MQLDDTAALVTGAASGLGVATAQALAEHGALVFALDLAKAVEARLSSTA
jgi:NAD(P)-dependent dehydrogenase (short-subunit alcohol dehydrogenase family)